MTLAALTRARPGPGLAALIVALYALMAIFAPWLAPWQINDVVGEAWQPPSAAHPFGTDMIGRDVLSRMLLATRETLLLAGSATLISVFAGILLSFIATLQGGWTEHLLSRLNDLVMALPALILILFLIALLPREPVWLALVIALVEVSRIYRLARLLSAEIASRDFVDAARLRGESTLWIARHEILPNCWRPLLSEAALRFGFAILMLSTVSFLGLGIQPPATDWGSLIRENKDGLLFGAVAALFPGAAIALLLLSVGVVADGFSDSQARHDR